MPRDVELLVVGAGPAGLAAASEATRSGVPTLLVDAGETTGGQYYARPPGGRWDEGLPPWLVAGARTELLEVRLRTAVWGAFGDSVALVEDSRSELVRPASIVVATGAIERPLPFPGWDQPGSPRTGRS
jgi:NADPH-dependent 2,4-dienoyl-CoA reductase/sulfur reductase-like enzyme